MSHDLADLLMDDLSRVLDRLRSQPAPQRGPEAASFAHGAGPGPSAPTATGAAH
jgi:glutamate decarboxylase